MLGASLNPNACGKCSPRHTHLGLFREKKLPSLLLPTLTAGRLPPPLIHTFSRKLLCLAALARDALAALHTLGGPSSWSSAQALKVWGRGWSWPSRFPCSFLTALACPVHCSSSTRVTGRDGRSEPGVPCDGGWAVQLQVGLAMALAKEKQVPDQAHVVTKAHLDWLQWGLLESLGRLSSKELSALKTETPPAQTSGSQASRASHHSQL